MAHHTHVSVDPTHFAARLIQDCLNEATVEYWLRRAEWFDTCNPLLALNCRRHAWLLAETADSQPSADVLAALNWAAGQ